MPRQGGKYPKKQFPSVKCAWDLYSLYMPLLLILDNLVQEKSANHPQGLTVESMVLMIDGNSEIVAFKALAWIERSHNSEYQNRPIFINACTTRSEVPSTISTMVEEVLDSTASHTV